MAPTTLLRLPNEMLDAIFTTIANDASTTDALSTSCRTLRQVWTSSAELILYRAMSFYTGARDVALAQDFLETQELALLQNYQETSRKHGSSQSDSPFTTLRSAPEYSHLIAHHPLVPKVSPATPLAPAPVPNVLIPSQGIESKHISLIQKLAQKAQRLCDLVEEHLVRDKLDCHNATCRARPPTLLAYERTRIIHAYYLLRLYLLLQSWSLPDEILTARHTLTDHFETMHPRERRLLHEVLKCSINQEAFKDLFVANDPDAASDDPYATDFATRNHFALRKTYRDICSKVEFPDDDECIYSCVNAKSMFGPEGSIPGEEGWGREKLTSSRLFKQATGASVIKAW
ncbi:hypothetical protein BDV97DRAFT_397467 [Delphinella strobiligena]|nr:hypothetical protein BDV97DRAFT_397467 [Delphinella strobiligena]